MTTYCLGCGKRGSYPYNDYCESCNEKRKNGITLDFEDING